MEKITDITQNKRASIKETKTKETKVGKFEIYARILPNLMVDRYTLEHTYNIDIPYKSLIIKVTADIERIENGKNISKDKSDSIIKEMNIFVIELVQKKYNISLEQMKLKGIYEFRVKKNPHLLLSRFIMEKNYYIDGMVIDHINHDILDNQKENLRICVYAENSRNRKMNKNEDGVYLSKSKDSPTRPVYYSSSDKIGNKGNFFKNRKETDKKTCRKRK
jgi:hypothetical protein